LRQARTLAATASEDLGREAWHSRLLRDLKPVLIKEKGALLKRWPTLAEMCS
jgi:hypothetical protein